MIQNKSSYDSIRLATACQTLSEFSYEEVFITMKLRLETIFAYQEHKGTI